MATTDTRSGFRLPWSTDRAQDDITNPDTGEGAPESAVASDQPAATWTESDFTARPAIGSSQAVSAGVPPPAAAQPAPAPKKPTKLMADLAAAIRATTEAARDQRLSQLDSEATGIVEMIRAQSDEGAVALRRQSDEDVAAIREWAKAEIARIKDSCEAKIADRKHVLEQEVADHAAAIEDRVAEVHRTVDGYRRAMDAYFASMQAEQDPARLATMAEAMPDAPTIETLTDLDNMQIHGAAARRAASEQEVEPEAASIEGSASPVEASSASVEASVQAPESDGSESQGDGDIVVSADRIAKALGGFVDAATPDQEHAAEPAQAASPFADGAAADAATGEDTPRWAAGEPDESQSAEGGAPVDRGAIMAALEAAAEAVVAAEAAAESAETAEAAADAAETAAERAASQAVRREGDDADAQAALSARVDAGGFDTESYQDRLASLMPGHTEGDAEGEPRTTQVIVTGLVSVASIASFKRHLGRVAGVTGVAVASGPDGEFIFNVSSRADVSFRDAIPTMPGFAARVVATGNGVINVTAHDPEAEG